MPDRRRHRGAHPGDKLFFGAQALPALCDAASDLCWLMDRGYAPKSSLKIVGDRFRLARRQRTAVARCVCSQVALQRRCATRVSLDNVRGQQLWIDGYNVLTSIEAALAGGVMLKGRDGCLRDMASMHGSYRKVAETEPAARLLGVLLAGRGVMCCHWLLDKPVSNSGRLRHLLREIADSERWNWEVELVMQPDRILAETPELVATADSHILDHCQQWVNLVHDAVQESVPDAWRLDLA